MPREVGLFTTDCPGICFKETRPPDAHVAGAEDIGSTTASPVGDGAVSGGSVIERTSLRRTLYGGAVHLYPRVEPTSVSPERRTTLLVILDGFGHRTATEDNATLQHTLLISTGCGERRPTRWCRARV